ncbi:MAG TPA: ParB/RepB/Spo0J family partition protein [Actinophytocola sp.]|uniref:ParB/RepB/Spo0J family partition protein n=1 Tax=Actinophytocola sp. TaxID=1872138 RepID=UPI002DDCB3BD|nr:ParB/RepB/Spo0J family partition protein [Actinophytocola sp.]HEV2780633.1 ParB/RepB/Spo0J family partition protein [Actinophytocola sp.]
MSLAERSTDDHVACAEADLDQVGSSLSWIESHPVVSVGIDQLVFEDSPRRGGQDAKHVQLLAEAGEALPPITVHRPSMRVIDGAHRVRAAALNGRTMIDARLIDCDQKAAFVLAVKANVTHGLPLSRADRSAAAGRIIASHPQWSDRAVAAATGLSDKTVSRIRAQCATDSTPAATARVGRDGRIRPLDTGNRREQAAAVIRAHPRAGLRQIARVTGLSPATVRDVRQRIDRGEHPVPHRYRNTTTGTPPATVPAAPAEPALPSPGATAVARTPAPLDLNTLLTHLGNDPALRLTEAGRHTLRLLHRCLVDHEQLAHLERGIPDHWAPHLAHLARRCAAAWHQLAEQLQQRAA